MKKLITLLLCAVMALSAVGIASGETSYETLKSYFQDPQQQGFLGTAFVMTPEGSSEHYTMIIYNAEDKAVYLFGDNAAGVYEAAMWADVGPVDGLSVFLSVCDAWETISANCTEGYQLVAGVFDGDTKFLVSTQEEADIAVKALTEATGQSN